MCWSCQPSKVHKHHCNVLLSAYDSLSAGRPQGMGLSSLSKLISTAHPGAMGGAEAPSMPPLSHREGRHVWALVQILHLISPELLVGVHLCSVLQRHLRNGTFVSPLLRNPSVFKGSPYIFFLPLLHLPQEEVHISIPPSPWNSFPSSAVSLS